VITVVSIALLTLVIKEKFISVNTETALASSSTDDGVSNLTQQKYASAEEAFRAVLLEDGDVYLPEYSDRGDGKSAPSGYMSIDGLLREWKGLNDEEWKQLYREQYGVEFDLSVVSFTFVDLDGDRLPEAVLKVRNEGLDDPDPFCYLVLHYFEEYGVLVAYAPVSLDDLKENGMFYRRGDGESYCQMRFPDDPYNELVTETDIIYDIASIDYSQRVVVDEESGLDRPTYYYNGEIDTTDNGSGFYETRLQFNESQEVAWYDFTEDNIAFSIDQIMAY